MLTDRKYLLARYWSNAVLGKIGPLFSGSIVNVSGWDDRDKQSRHYRDYFPNATEYHRTNYGGHRGYQGGVNEVPLDLTADLDAALHERYDVVFNHTTLEHIFDVRKAFENLCRMTRDVAIIVVPFSQVQHESASYGDFWRFTPTCLRTLFAENGMSVIFEAESPHRDAAVYLLFVASRHPERHRTRMPRYTPIATAGSWIGASILVSGIQFLGTRAKRILGRNGD